MILDPQDSLLSLEDAEETVRASLGTIWQDFLEHTPHLIGGLAVLTAGAVFAWILRAVLDRILRRTKLRRSLRELSSRLAFIGVWAVVLLLAAMVVFPGLTPTRALGGLGVASVAVGFAFKDIFENFFAGILILWRFPFDNGDDIVCGDVAGRVEEITIRNTMIRRPTGELIVVPNSELFTNPVDVLTDRSERRVSIVCGIAYDEDIPAALDVVRFAVERCDSVSKAQPVDVFAQEFGPSSIDLEIAWWTGARPRQVRSSRSEVVRSVRSALEQAGIQIPFPHRTLLFSDSSPPPEQRVPSPHANHRSVLRSEPALVSAGPTTR